VNYFTNLPDPSSRTRPLDLLGRYLKWVPETEIKMILGSRARTVREDEMAGVCECYISEPLNYTGLQTRESLTT
jgi:hypothetical protein